MTTILGIGGFVALVNAWREGELEADAATVIDQASSDSASLAERYLLRGKGRSSRRPPKH